MLNHFFHCGAMVGVFISATENGIDNQSSPVRSHRVA
jgi:hypothetical protein